MLIYSEKFSPGNFTAIFGDRLCPHRLQKHTNKYSKPEKEEAIQDGIIFIVMSGI